MKNYAAWRRALGPGLLFSGGAIGTSHLVQSTRAGAMFGLALVLVIVLANVLKYPSFRFGLDYAHATRRSLLAGYRELGRWQVWVFAILVAPLAPIIFAAVSAATSGIVITLLGIPVAVPVLASGLLLICAALILNGGYKLLDKVNGWLLGFLVLSTLVTTAVVLPRVEWGTLTDFAWTGNAAALFFIVALVGFMPNPLDVSVGLSVWKLESDLTVQDGERGTVEETRIAFLAPYVLTTVMALCFCVMGAGVMHPQGIEPVSDAPGFAAQIVGLYREALGEEMAVLAGVSALSVMLTTVIAAIDLYARTFSVAISGPPTAADAGRPRKSYIAMIALFVGLAICALLFLLRDFAAFLDFTTTATFLAAPVIAVFNHLVVTRCAMPDEARPSSGMRALSWVAIAVMSALAVTFLVLRFG